MCFGVVRDATVAILLLNPAPYISSLSPLSEYLIFANLSPPAHISILEWIKLISKTTTDEDFNKQKKISEM